MVLALIMPTRAGAQQGVVGSAIPVCVARVDTAPSPVRAIRGAGHFDCTTRQRDLGPGNYLVRSGPLDLAPGVRVRTASLWQERTDLWALHADGALTRLSGSGVETTRRIRPGAVVEYRLPDRGTHVTRLLWDVRGAANYRGVLLGASATDADAAARADMTLSALYAGFAGLCLALLCYNLALWSVLRHPFQLAYCAMVAALLAYAFSSSGALAWAWPGLENNTRLRVNYLTLAASAVAALLFARTYLGGAVFRGAVGRAAAAIAAALTVSAIAFAGLAGSSALPLDQIYALSFAGLAVVGGMVLVRAWAGGGPAAWLFTLAWAAPITFAVLRIAGNFGLVGWHFWLDQSTVVAMAVEALLSSLAVAHRVLGLARERDMARAAEAAALMLAARDPLTGLLNRRAFLERGIGRDGRHALLIVDVDHFKQVNDALGHDRGDEVLRTIADAVAAAAPPDALVARLGGEEFAILTAEDNAPDPRDVLADIRRRRMPFDLAVTASAGWCAGPIATESDWKRLYRGADRALFEAKAMGRDRARRAPALDLPEAA